MEDFDINANTSRIISKERRIYSTQYDNNELLKTIKGKICTARYEGLNYTEISIINNIWFKDANIDEVIKLLTSDKYGFIVEKKFMPFFMKYFRSKPDSLVIRW